MLQSSNQLRWIFDDTTRRYYYYDARSDCYTYQDGQRVPRPLPNISGARESTADLAESPTIFNAHYSLGTGSRQSSAVNPHSILSRQQSGTAAMPNQIQRSSLALLDPLAQQVSNLTFETTQTRPQPSQTQFSQEQSSQPQVSQGLQRVRPQVWQDETGGRFFSAHNPANDVRTTIQTGPANLITDPYFLRAGIPAQRLLIATPGQAEKLFEEFRRRLRPKKYFTVGKVFHVLWTEPAGESNTVVTTLEPGTSVGRFGERVFSKVRKFVVVREGESYCSALPIATYGRRGVSKPGIVKSEHSIIYTGRTAPSDLSEESPVRGEPGMRPDAIRVIPDVSTDKLDPISRLDYGKVHTIQHNIKARSFGMVHPRSVNALMHQFRNVWADLPTVLGSDKAPAGSFGGMTDNNVSTSLQREVTSTGPRSSASTKSATSGRSQGRSVAGSARRVHPQSTEAIRAKDQPRTEAAVRQLVQSGWGRDEALRYVVAELGNRRNLAPQSQQSIASENTVTFGDDEDSLKDGSQRSREMDGKAQARSPVTPLI